MYTFVRSQLPSIAAIGVGLLILILAYMLRQGTISLPFAQSNNGAPTRPATLQHLYGSKKAQTTIVEFADYSCGHCANAHDTLRQLVDESNGTIAWEYRHLPILQAVSSEAARTAECVAELSSDADAFWKFSQELFAKQQTLSSAMLASIAGTYVPDVEALHVCMARPDIQARVDDDASAARLLGARGTPFSVIVKKDGTAVPVVGALPYNQWKALLASS